MVSGKLRDYEYFLNVMFVKTTEISVKKFAFLLGPIFAIFCRLAFQKIELGELQ